MDAPLYDVGTTVYLRESAAIGHLEAVVISGMMYNNNNWIYAIRAGREQPSSMPYYGDRISLVNSKTLYFSESELVELCDALTLAEANAERALQRIQIQKASLCPDVTE